MRLIQAAKGKLILVGYALMVVFGWWVPNNLLDTSPNLRIFTDFMASIVPQIDRVTALGGVTAGNANRVLYSVLWLVGIALGIVYAGVVFKKLARRESLDWGTPTPSWKVFLYSIGAAYLVWWEGLYMSSLRPELRLVKFSLINRFGAGLWAPLLSVGTGFFIAGGIVICVVFAVYVIRLGKGERNE